jgi:hypothetical protein
MVTASDFLNGDATSWAWLGDLVDFKLGFSVLGVSLLTQGL